MDRPVALVLGASRGLGFLVARELGLAGHDLAICARSGDGLEATRPELEATGATVLVLPADLSSQPAAATVVDRTVDRFGRLDVVVANAGIIQVGPVASLTSQDVADAQDAIFWTAVHPVLAALEVMRAAGGGRIIVVTSIGGKVPSPHLLPYTAAKFATVGFAEALRTEVAKEGITVTTVVPGLLRTGSPRNALVAGDRTAEYTWFALADSIPLLSMDAARAARRIVRAGLAGRGELVLTPLAKVGLRVHGVAPAVTTRLLTVVDRLLPAAPPPDVPGGTEPQPGHRLPTMPRWFRTLTGLTGRAAREHHEYDDETPAPR